MATEDGVNRVGLEWKVIGDVEIGQFLKDTAAMLGESSRRNFPEEVEGTSGEGNFRNPDMRSDVRVNPAFGGCIEASQMQSFGSCAWHRCLPDALDIRHITWGDNCSF
jgi:hypothetical protein